MNYDEIVRLARDVGLNENRARVAAAIAMAESSGDPSQVTHDSDDDSYGLWQINMKGSMGPDRRRQFGLPNNEALLDPRRNAMVMASLSNAGGNFSKWTTYTSGKYKKFLKDPSLADRLGTAVDGVTDGAQNAVDNVQDIGAAVSTLASATVKTAVWISDAKNWVRIAYVIGGAAVVIIGIYQVLKTGGVPVRIIPKSTKKLVKVVKSSSQKGK